MCTAIVIEKKLYIAWLGDSQAMMIKAGSNVDLMNPHKPNRDDEKQRIEAAGGVVVWLVDMPTLSPCPADHCTARVGMEHGESTECCQWPERSATES